MILKSIKLINFQTHQEVKLDLSPTITTIKGPTDSGKSSVLRALRWVCLNDIPGDEFIREGATCARVILRAGDSEVTRVSFIIG